MFQDSACASIFQIALDRAPLHSVCALRNKSNFNENKAELIHFQSFNTFWQLF